MGHLNSFSAPGGGNLNKNFLKIQMPGVCPGGGMLRLRFDWYIITSHITLHLICINFQVVFFENNYREFRTTNAV